MTSLPEAWSKLNDAYWYVKSFVSPLQSYPNIDQMAPAHREDFISKSALTEWQKDELRQCTKERTKLYAKQIFWHKLAEAQKLCRDGYTYLIKNGIFMERAIYLRLSEVHDLTWNALLEHQLNEEMGERPLERERISKLRTAGDELMKDVEDLVHQRLWPGEQAAGGE